MSFDPYHQWLGIPPAQQPPDCYQLLGIRRFEPNAAVISNAAERQLLMLKSLQSGPNGALTQQLMKQVSAARVRLLNPEKKAQYDAGLRQRGRRRATPPPVPPQLRSERSDGVSSGESAPSLSTALPEAESVAARAGGRQPIRDRRRVPMTSGTWIVLSAVAVGALTMMVFWGANDRGSAPTARQPGGEPRFVPTPKRPTRTGSDVRLDTGPPIGPPAVGPSGPRQTVAGAAPGIAVEKPETGGPQSATASISVMEEDTTAVGAKAPLPPKAVVNAPVLDDGSPDTPLVDDSAGETGTDSGAGLFNRLPTQLNVIGTVAATGAGYVFIGKLGADANDTWSLSIEDFASSVGESKFIVGAGEKTEGGVRWPLYRSAVGRPAPDEPGTVPNDSVGMPCAQVEAISGAFSLQFADPQNEELLKDIGCCGLIVESNLDRHQVQLSLYQKIEPVALSLDKSKQTVEFHESPVLDQVSAPRLELELLQVLQGTNEILPNSGARGEYDEELLVSLDDSLGCELGITLTRSAEQAELVIAPRYLRNDRKLPMVPTKLAKEIVRTKSQLMRNQRDLAEAQYAVRQLPQQISRVQATPARSALEAASKQSQFSQLSSKLNSAQSRVRRLSKVNPELSKDLERMQQVLKYANQLIGQVTLHFRVLARGEKGRFLLLVAGTGASLSAGSGVE